MTGGETNGAMKITPLYAGLQGRLINQTSTVGQLFSIEIIPRGLSLWELQHLLLELLIRSALKFDTRKGCKINVSSDKVLEAGCNYYIIFDGSVSFDNFYFLNLSLGFIIDILKYLQYEYK